MTAILGLTCTDGILMLADTEESLSQESKSECDKLRSYLCPNGQVLLGGAGQSHLVEYAMRHIGLSLLQKRRTWEEIEVDLNVLNRRIFQETLGPYQGFAAGVVPEWIDMLIAVQSFGQLRLFKWTQTTVIPANTYHTSIGAGVAQMHPMLLDMNFVFSAKAMLLFGVYVMRQTKRIVQSCGGKTEAVALRPDGTRTYFFSEQTSRVEEFLVALNDYTLGTIWSLVSGISGDEEDFEKTCGSIPADIKHLRDEYQELLR